MGGRRQPRARVDDRLLERQPAYRGKGIWMLPSYQTFEACFVHVGRERETLSARVVPVNLCGTVAVCECVCLLIARSRARSIWRSQFGGVYQISMKLVVCVRRVQGGG